MQIHSVLKKSVIATGVAIALASSGAQAISAGTDLNLSAKAKAGGMAGAAYTMPQEASAAVFGNPATLTQFKGFNMNFGASLIGLKSVDVDTESALTGNSGISHSDADNYIVPDFGMTLEVAPGLVIGTGLEVDAGLGVDMRDDPINLIGVPGAITLPLNVELISFNANIGLGYQATEKLSLGAAVTIGFGLAQLGTAGDTSGLPLIPGVTLPGLNPANADFGGTTSSVHDIGFGGSLGATYALQEGIMLSAAYKSQLQYNFRNIIEFDGAYQSLKVAQPAEIVVGVALDNILAQGLLVEADVIWKNWSDANTYEDAYDDQFLIVVGAQYQMGNWAFRAGYSWAENLMRDDPNDTLGGLAGLGTIPLKGAPLGQDVVKIAQMSLLPVIWEHTVTAGIGYQFTEAVSVDAYVAYAFGEEDSQHLDVVSTLGAGSTDINVEVDPEFMIGAGINVAMP
jgi:long-chain fatty acid transport protein